MQTFWNRTRTLKLKHLILRDNPFGILVGEKWLTETSTGHHAMQNILHGDLQSIDLSEGDFYKHRISPTLGMYLGMYLAKYMAESPTDSLKARVTLNQRLNQRLDASVGASVKQPIHLNPNLTMTIKPPDTDVSGSPANGSPVNGSPDKLILVPNSTQVLTLHASTVK